MNKRSTGSHYEDVAAAFLKNLGYQIRERNYRNAGAEVDIIAEKEGRISFIEVKYRRDDSFGMPSEAVNARKKAKILAASELYIMDSGLGDVERSYDIVEILGSRIRLIANCFGDI